MTRNNIVIFKTKSMRESLFKLLLSNYRKRITKKVIRRLVKKYHIEKNLCYYSTTNKTDNKCLCLYV